MTDKEEPAWHKMVDQIRHQSLSGLSAEVDKNVAAENHVIRALHRIETVVQIQAPELDHLLNLEFHFHPALLVGNARAT